MGRNEQNEPAAGVKGLLWTRRRFLTAAATLAGAPAGAFLYAREVEPYWLQVVQQDLPIVDLPDRLAGLTLMQLSDLHVGVVEGTFL